MYIEEGTLWECVRNSWLLKCYQISSIWTKEGERDSLMKYLVLFFGSSGGSGVARQSSGHHIIKLLERHGLCHVSLEVSHEVSCSCFEAQNALCSVLRMWKL